MAVRAPVDRESEIVALLHTVITEVQALRREVQRDRAPRPALSRADQALVHVLLPAIAGAVGSDWFVVHEVIALAAVQLVGRLLRRASGRPVAGLLVERGGTESQRAQWRVVATE
jgi:hypothetical protein